MIIKVKINQFHYPIKIGENLLEKLPREILSFTKSKKIVVLIDKNLSKQYEKKN